MVASFFMEILILLSHRYPRAVEVLVLDRSSIPQKKRLSEFKCPGMPGGVKSFNCSVPGGISTPRLMKE